MGIEIQGLLMPPPPLPSTTTTMSAQPHFEAQIAEIGTLPPPQFDTTNLELVFYGGLEYITLPEHNNNGGASIKQAPVHTLCNKAYLWATQSV